LVYDEPAELSQTLPSVMEALLQRFNLLTWFGSYTVIG
jgi:hypothetical protein